MAPKSFPKASSRFICRAVRFYNVLKRKKATTPFSMVSRIIETSNMMISPHTLTWWFECTSFHLKAACMIAIIYAHDGSWVHEYFHTDLYCCCWKASTPSPSSARCFNSLMKSPRTIWVKEKPRKIDSVGMLMRPYCFFSICNAVIPSIDFPSALPSWALVGKGVHPLCSAELCSAILAQSSKSWHQGGG